jgi:hypothetical protein
VFVDLVGDCPGFDLSVSIATCDGEGRFRITGLEPGAHVLTLDDVPGANLIDVGSLESAAPASGVVFAPDVARFTVDVTSAGQPVAQSKLQLVDSPNWHDFWTQDDGRAIGLARSDKGYVLYANKEGHETRSVELPAEGRALDAAVAIELPAMQVGTASLVLEPRAAGELEVDRVTIRMEATVDTPYSLVDEHVTLRDGAFTLTGLHPGPYHVTVEPYENTIGPYYKSLRRCSEFTVELEDGEVHRRAVDFELGGRLRVAVTGLRGPELESRCRVIDETGAELFVRFVTRSFEDNIITVGANSETTSLTETAEVYPNLRPGTYLIRLEVERHHPVERTVVVREGEVTEVELPVSRL